MEEKQPIKVETHQDRINKSDARNTGAIIFFIFIMITFMLIGGKLGDVFNWKFEGGAEPGAFIGIIAGLIVSLFFKAIREVIMGLFVVGIAGAAIYYLYVWLIS